MRTLVRAAALLVLAGCKGEAVEARPDVGADEKLGELYEKAHRDAMLHTGQLALKVFSLEDPVGAAALGVAPLAPAPVSSGATAPLREAHRAAWAEAREVDGEVLTPTDRTLLLAMRFGLDRVNDRLTAAQPARTDPTWYAQEVRRYLGALAAAVAFGPCPDCRAGLDALAGEIEAAVAALGAASKAALDAASEDWIAVDKQLGALRERAADPQDVAPEAIERARGGCGGAPRARGAARGPADGGRRAVGGRRAPGTRQDPRRPPRPGRLPDLRTPARRGGTPDS